MIDNRNLFDKVYTYLRKEIIANNLKPGSRINYDELSNKLQISKTPLRDAINRLEEDGLIEVKPRSGTFVKNIEMNDVIDVYQVRKALELLALELACERLAKPQIEDMIKEMNQVDEDIIRGEYDSFFSMDRKFHQWIIEWSNNKLLMKAMNGIEARVQRLTVLTTNNNERPKYSNKQHQEILYYMLQRDIENAKKIMICHIDEAKLFVLKDLNLDDTSN